MRSYEIAAVKMAVKRSLKAKDIIAGYNSITKWHKSWQEKGINANIKDVLKCFIKWVKHNRKEVA